MVLIKSYKASMCIKRQVKTLPVRSSATHPFGVTQHCSLSFYHWIFVLLVTSTVSVWDYVSGGQCMARVGRAETDCRQMAATARAAAAATVRARRLPETKLNWADRFRVVAIGIML